MIITSNNLLKTKKEKLDYCFRRYAKNRHTKFVLWSIKQSLLGLLVSSLTRFRKKTFNEKSTTDILILHPSKKSRHIGAKNSLIEVLQQKGLSISHEVMKSEKDILKLDLYTFSFKGPIRLRVYEYYASYLKKKYQPKVILTERNGTILSSFLRSSHKKDCVTFHLAHSVLTNESSHYEYIDFDYYCIYGPSSLNYLENLEPKFGSCEIVKSGSYLFGPQDNTPKKPNAPVLLLGTGPGYEATDECLKLYNLVREWQEKTSQQIFIRLHPRSKGAYWSKYTSDNIQILPNESFSSSINRCSLVLATYTNAVLDAALANKPVQLLKAENSTDHMEIERFFGDGATSPSELEYKINNIRNNYDKYIQMCNDFVNHHLYKSNNCIESICNSLTTVLDKYFDT